MQINIKVFYKLLSIWVCIARPVQSIQNKFAYLYNISRKKWVVKFLFCLQIKSWFLPAGKQKIVLQVDIIIWYYQYLSNISKKMLRMKLIFCLGINIKSFLKLIPSFLVCVCVARRLLFLCNILWKKLVMKLILCMHWSMKFSYKSILWFWLGCSSILKVPKLGSL